MVNYQSAFFLFGLVPASVLGFFVFTRRMGLFAGQLFLAFVSLIFLWGYGHENVGLFFLSLALNWWLHLLLKKFQGNSVLLISGLALNVGCFWAAKEFMPETAGIGFLFLLQVMFLVDTSEGLLSNCSVITYLSSMLFYPKVLAGPLYQVQEFERDLKKTSSLDSHHVLQGLFLFFSGWIQKFFLAARFADMTEQVRNLEKALTFFPAWKFGLANALELFFDLNGYTHMALGIALFFNVHLPENFRRPFRSLSLIDFWSRWHISLGLFFRTYVVTAVLRKMKRPTLAKAQVVSVFSMLFMGVWHAFTLKFALYGFLHGVGLAINHFWRSTGTKLSRFISWPVTFVFVIFTFVIFSSPSLTYADRMISAMMAPSLSDFDVTSFLLIAAAFLAITFGRFPQVSFSGLVLISLAVFERSLIVEYLHLAPGEMMNTVSLLCEADSYVKLIMGVLLLYRRQVRLPQVMAVIATSVLLTFFRKTYLPTDWILWIPEAWFVPFILTAGLFVVFSSWVSRKLVTEKELPKLVMFFLGTLLALSALIVAGLVARPGFTPTFIYLRF